MTAPTDIANAISGAQKATIGIGSWPQWGMLISILGMGLIAWIKRGPAQTKAETDARAALRADEARLRVEMLARVEKLEEKVDKNEAECNERIEAALKLNDARWHREIEAMRRDYEKQIDGLSRQIAALQVDTGKVLRLAAGSNEPSTSMERVVSNAIAEITDRLDPR